MMVERVLSLKGGYVDPWSHCASWSCQRTHHHYTTSAASILHSTKEERQGAAWRAAKGKGRGTVSDMDGSRIPVPCQLYTLSDTFVSLSCLATLRAANDEPNTVYCMDMGMRRSWDYYFARVNPHPHPRG